MVSVRRINLCADGASLVERGLHAQIVDCDEPPAAPDDDDDAPTTPPRNPPADGAPATPPTAVDDGFNYKSFNPARDARRALRNVYVGDPVLETVEEVRSSLATGPSGPVRALLLTPCCSAADDANVWMLPLLPQVPQAERKAKIVQGAWILVPSEWFEYMDNTAMPLYVTAQIGKMVPRTARFPAYSVKMIGDGAPQISVDYYLDKHPQAYAGMEDFYLLNPKVKFLSGAPETIEA